MAEKGISPLCHPYCSNKGEKKNTKIESLSSPKRVFQWSVKIEQPVASVFPMGDRARHILIVVMEDLH
jgi:hypothetical protein